MKAKTKLPELMETSYELWTFLKMQAGLDVKFYDADLVEELRTRLFLPPVGDFDQLLKTTKISTEDFITAFFQTIQPYAEMMIDLLRMFEQVGANRTDKNIVVKFNFDNNLPDLGFDLKHFRVWLETWRKLKAKFLANVWTSQSLWNLNGILRENNRESVLRNEEARRWVLEYRERRVWPNYILSAPSSGDLDLDQQLAKAWRIWLRVVEESSKYGQDRNILRELTFGRYSNSDTNRQDEEDAEEWPATLLGGLDSDFWASSFITGAYQKVETLSRLPSREYEQKARELASMLEKFFSSLPSVQVEKDESIRELQEYLQLPIWQRRHEFYSVWISTQLLNALSESPIRVHHSDGALIFSFSGTHLATADSFEPRLHVWAELRSPLADPVGKGRKQAIQPDYSLITDPVTSPQSSILEVECKQYRRPSKSNFSNALTDYARGRPNAFVVLVNYGRVDESILNTIDPGLRNRVSLIGEMRPGSKESQKKFKEIVQDAIHQRYGSISGSTPPSEIINLDDTGLINLSWGISPRDLDLHLRIDVDSESHEICYSDKGSLVEEPWAELNIDETHGSGSEKITIKRWKEGKYHFAVKNYSEEIPLAGCAAHILFSCGQVERELLCPNEGAGNWWLLFILDGQTGKIEIVNKIVDQFQ